MLFELRNNSWLNRRTAYSAPGMEENPELWLSNTTSYGDVDGIGSESQPKALNEDGESFMCNKGTSDVDSEKR